jgi:hypothetical protein
MVLAINATSLLILGGLLVVVGLVLAFVGRKVWTPFMSFVGAVAGGTVGYLVGAYYAPGSYFAALVLGIIGSILGSILFNYLVKIALALITAAIPATLVYFWMRGNPVADQTAQDTPVIVAILVLVVVFAIAYYFVEELIGVVTALVGGFLLGIGVFLVGLSQDMPPAALATPAIGAGGLVFLVGSIVQTLAIRAAKKGSVWRLRRARATAAAPAPAPYATPRPPAAPAPPSSPPANPPPPPPS